jgi:anti-sigma B factor antagonist
MADLFSASLSGDPPILTVNLRGELTALADEALLGAYHEATERGATGLILDFSGIEFMNSAGIALIITILTESRKANQKLRCARVNEHYRKILAMLGVDQYAPIYPTEGDARASLE